MELIMRPNLGVNVAIIQDGHILLTKREDFEVWCMPGGAVDPNESLADAAVREALEETGLTVQLTRLVGVYSQPDWLTGNHIALFAGTPAGGALCLCPGETVDVRYFPVTALPADLVPAHRDRIQDVLAGYGGSIAVTQPGRTISVSREELYALRDRSGLSRAEFYHTYFSTQTKLPAHTDVPGRADNWE
jgi:ADP-ribose pyrophosphatase YjhB (NUDIX family)